MSPNAARGPGRWIRRWSHPPGRPGKIPVVMCIDVEPDERVIEPPAPRAWAGFERIVVRPCGGCPPASYEGCLDRVDGEVISGWVYDTTRPDAPIDVAIYDGAALLTAATAATSGPTCWLLATATGDTASTSAFRPACGMAGPIRSTSRRPTPTSRWRAHRGS